jgi:hypothetical protein
MSDGGGETSDPTPSTLRAPRSEVAAAAPAPPAAAVASERYVLDREIGRGGMGRVFAGRDLRLHRPIAVKMLRVQDGALATRSSAR